MPYLDYMPVSGKTGLLPRLTLAVVKIETTDAILGQSFVNQKGLRLSETGGYMHVYVCEDACLCMRGCMFMYARMHVYVCEDAPHRSAQLMRMLFPKSKA